MRERTGRTPLLEPSRRPPFEDMASGATRGRRFTAVGPVSAPSESGGALAQSDDALAIRFAEQAAHLRWTPGLDWMAHDGVVWSRDEKLQRYALARKICREMASRLGGEEGRRIASAKTINAVIGLARSDKRLVVPSGEWDAAPLQLNHPNGLLDMATGRSRPRKAEYLTQVTQVSPVEGSTPRWDRFVQEICCGDRDLIEFLRRSLGYCLTGDRREQVLFFWYGAGANGKSVLAELLQWLAGSYALKLPATALMHSRGDRHPTELAQLRGRRLAVSSELDESAFFNEPLVKELTGDVTLSARFMRGDFFEFQMTHKHVLIGNHKPRLRGSDPAIGRRMLLVPFLANFNGVRRDPLLLEKLRAEGPGVLHWISRGAAAWAAEGLAIPRIVREASDEYMGDHDDLALWLSECCDATGRSRATPLYASYKSWKLSRGEDAPSQTIWGERFAARPGIRKRKTDGVMVYEGVSLKNATAREGRESSSFSGV